MSKGMNVNINFYGHSVTINPEDIADGLDLNATEDEIREALNEDIENALREDDFPSYTHDGEDVVEAVKAELARRRDEENED